MASLYQIQYIKENKDIIKEPILIIGSKMYVYDEFDLALELNKLGFYDITGIDIQGGAGVDVVADIMDTECEFLRNHQNYFRTSICMEVLTYIKNPFDATANIHSLVANDGHMIISECVVRKMSDMPVDYWRFTYFGLKRMYDGFCFYEERSRKSLIRQKGGALLKNPEKILFLSAYVPLKEESKIHFYIRRILRKWFGKGMLLISTFYPEQSIYAVGKKNSF